MSYIAVEKIIEVLGQKFQSFKTEDGEVVFSQTSAALGLDIASSTILRLKQSEAFKALPGNSSVILRLKVSHSIKPIAVVTMAELANIVSLLAERGHDRAVAMQQASFAIMLQQSVDVAYGVQRESREYTEAAADLALLLEKTRRELREMSGRITNPTIACNLYQVNNDLVYGSGYNRDSYDGRDAAQKHSTLKCLEMMQAGMKMAGMPLSDIVTLSHDMYQKRLNN